jgi:hypothetical protein
MSEFEKLQNLLTRGEITRRELLIRLSALMDTGTMSG